MKTMVPHKCVLFFLLNYSTILTDQYSMFVTWQGTVNSIALFPDNTRWIVTGSDDKSVRESSLSSWTTYAAVFAIPASRG